MKLKLSPVLFLLILTLFALITTVFYRNFAGQDPGTRLMQKIEKMEVGKKRIDEVRKLAELVGPKRAIELLNASSILKYGETHLLSHAIGEVAYKLYRQEALAECAEDYLNGCAHGLILSAISDVGYEGISGLVENCKKYPLFKYQMCLHAAGHSFLAATDYKDLNFALAKCEGLLKSGDENLLFCYNGVFMENTIGEHNGILPEAHPWLKRDDLLFPCNKIERVYLSSCYLNQVNWWTRILFGNIEKMASICNSKVPAEFRNECANSLARVVSTLKKNDLGEIEKDCSYLGDQLEPECIKAIALSAYSIGDESLPFILCRMIDNSNGKESCYEELTVLFSRNEIPEDKRQNLCQQFEKEFQYICQ